MCVAIVLYKNQDIDEEALRNSWRNNGDGVGYAYALDGILTIEKGFMDFESFYESLLEDAIEHPDINFIIHFRKASRGVVDEDNTHPFYIGKDKKLAFIHNGTFKGFGSESISDTKEVADLLSDLPSDFLSRREYLIPIAKIFGDSKVAFIDSNGEVLVYNKKAWEEYNGVLYSNGYYKDNAFRNSHNVLEYYEETSI